MGIAELRQKLEAARNTFEYRLEKILVEVAEQVCKSIETQGMTRSELAQRLAVTPAYITKLLNGNPNLTIKSLLRLSDAMGQTLDIRFAPKLVVAQSVVTSLAPAPSILPIPEYTITRTPAHVVTDQPLVLASSILPTPEYTITRTPAHVVTDQPNEVSNALALAA